MLRKTRWLLAIVVTATALGAVPGGPATADPGDAPAGASDNPTGGTTHTVTLLTGDVVTVKDTGKGCPQATVRPAEPDALFRQTCGPDGHLHVIPAKVAAQVGGLLDPDLFDVSALIADGYDDETSDTLPVIVRSATQNARVTGLDDVLALPSINAVAGHVPKKTGATAKRAADSLLAGATKVWLDRKVRATALTGGGHGTAPSRDLDRNLGQVAAPEAWKAGYTGKGVRVAVLDSGADFNHPDLVGRVVDRADFTVEGGDAVDHLGHGTHVASTIAGSGAAANGERRGVAPDARLVIGKVLDDHGSGSDSQIMVGMQWAAERADVVNMSLGGEAADDGNDPLSLAVDALSKQTGALFVISAGNSGAAISSPGSAASALTVGAVDGDDKLAYFSSRGPLVGGSVAKPELVAPGVDIVAARAAGTNLQDPIDQYYEGSSGTSMAAPHVAGAAALLAQRHPDWTGEQLKAALVGAADPLAGNDPYAVGAGRLNAARALGGPVSNQPAVNLGTFAYPQSGVSETTLTWTGDRTPATVNLDLDVTVTAHDGAPAPRGAASLSASRLALKRGGPAGVTLRLNRTALAARPGYYVATVTARTGRTLVSTTPVSFYVEPPSYDVTIRTKPIPAVREGADTSVSVEVTNLSDPLLYLGGAFGTPGDTLTVRVPAGRYAIIGAYISFYGDLETTEQQATIVGSTDVTVTGARSLTLDPARARPVTAKVDGVAANPFQVDYTMLRAAANGAAWVSKVNGVGSAPKVSVGELPQPGIGSQRAWSVVSLASPAAAGTPYHYYLVHEYPKGVPADPAFRVTTAERARLARIDERFHQIDLESMETQLLRGAYTEDGIPLAQTYEGGLTGNRTDYLSPDVVWRDYGTYGGTPVHEPPRTYLPGSRQIKIWARQPLHPGWSDNPAGAGYGCASDPTAPSRTRGNLHVDLVTFIDQHDRVDCLRGNLIGVTRSLALYRDGKLVGKGSGPYADFGVPQQAADYRLTYDVDASLLLPVSSRTSTSWTFRSAGPEGTGSVPLPLLALDYVLPLDLANHPTGGTAEFTVRQSRVLPAQKVTTFQVWTSTDDGGTWQSAPATRSGDSYRIELPKVKTGKAVSLRVKAEGNAGSGIDQTIIRAYQAG